MTMPQEDAVPAQILIKLGEMGAQLAVISATLGTISRGFDDHELRLRSLERNRWPLPTITALAAIAAVIVALLALLRR